MRRRERVVHGAQRARLCVALEQREIEHPQKRRVRESRTRASTPGRLLPHAVERRDWTRGPARRRRARDRRRRAPSARHRVRAEKLGGGPFDASPVRLSRISPPAPAPLAIASSSSTCLREKRGRRRACGAAHAAAAVDRACARCRSRVSAEGLARIEQFEAVAQIRPVGAVALHRVGVRHAPEMAPASPTPASCRTARRSAPRPAA